MQGFKGFENAVLKADSDLLHAAIAAFRDSDDFFDIAMATLALASTCVLIDDSESFDFLIDDVVELMEFIESPEDREEIMKELASVYVLKNDVKKALDLFETFTLSESKEGILETVFRSFENAVIINPVDTKGTLLEQNLRFLDQVIDKLDADSSKGFKAFAKARLAGLMSISGFDKESSRTLYDAIKLLCTGQDALKDLENVSRIYGILTGLEQKDLAEKVLTCIPKQDRIDILSEWSNNFIDKPELSSGLLNHASDLLSGDSDKNLVTDKLIEALVLHGRTEEAFELVDRFLSDESADITAMAVDSLFENSKDKEALELAESRGDTACRISSLCRAGLCEIRRNRSSQGSGKMISAIEMVKDIKEDEFLYKALLSQIARDLIEAGMVEIAEQIIEDLRGEMDVSALSGTLAEQYFRAGDTARSLDILSGITDHFQRMLSIGKITGLILEISRKSQKEALQKS